MLKSTSTIVFGVWKMLIYLKLLLTAFFWGGTFIAGRIVAQDVGPFSAAFFRFMIASVFLLFFTYKLEGKFGLPQKGQWIPVFLLGMTGVFSYNVFFFKGLKIISAGRAAVIIACNPIFIALLSAYFFKEKLNLIKVFGITVSVIGFVWYYEGIKELGPTKASLFINFVPISAVLLAFLILGEPITPSLLVGTILVSSGVYLTNATFNKNLIERKRLN